MIKQMLRKAYIKIIILIGITINFVYGVELLKEFFSPQVTDSIRNILISAISLQFGWAAILLWVVIKPFERRQLILFTALPMAIGNLLYSITQFINAEIKAAEIALNLGTGIFMAGLFVFAFFLCKQSDFLHGKTGK